MIELYNNQKFVAEIVLVWKVQFVLFGSRAHLASVCRPKMNTTVDIWRTLLDNLCS